MKILHVTEAANAGVGGHVLDLAAGLSNLGCVNHLVYSPLRTDSFFNSRLATAKLDGVFEIPIRRGPHASDFSSYRQLKRVIREFGPFDVIHAHSTKAGILCRIGAVRRSAKIVYTPNGIYSMNPLNSGLSAGFVKMVEQKLANRCERIIAVSPEEQLHMQESLGVEKRQIQMIPNGIRQLDWPSRAEIRNRWSLKPETVVFGFLGRLAPQKHPLMLIRAFGEIRQGKRDVRLMIAGAGPLADEAKELAANLGIADRIIWTGFKTADEVMPAFDVFVMPSRYEGMPYVMMEAISVGLPVVATRVGGTSLAIDEGSNGFVIDVDDVSCLANRLQQFVDCPGLLDEMGKQAHQKAASFDVNVMATRTLSLYQEIVRSQDGIRSKNRSRSNRHLDLSKPRSPVAARSEVTS